MSEMVLPLMTVKTVKIDTLVNSEKSENRYPG
jgi:hypothetical protein